jgi:hypothetical protein
MGQFHYLVVPHGIGWAYRLDYTYSPVFPTEAEAFEAAKKAAFAMHEEGDSTEVRRRQGGVWRTKWAVEDRVEV